MPTVKVSWRRECWLLVFCIKSTLLPSLVPALIVLNPHTLPSLGSSGLDVMACALRDESKTKNNNNNKAILSSKTLEKMSKRLQRLL